MFAVFVYLDVVGFIGRGKRIIGKGNIGMQMIGKNIVNLQERVYVHVLKKKK